MGIPVLMGGPHVTFLPEEALEHSDFIIRGEGERPLEAFIDAWEGNRNFDAVPNLSRLKDGRVVHNPMLPLDKDLDAIPHTDFTLLKPDRPARRFTPPLPCEVQSCQK